MKKKLTILYCIITGILCIASTNLKSQPYNIPGYFSDNLVCNLHPDPFCFTVVALFWRTWWFYNLFAIFIIFSVWVFIRYRIKSVEKQNKTLEIKVSERTAELESSKEKYMALIANMNEGLMVVDNLGTIYFVNTRMCEMTGYAENELIGKISHELLLDSQDQKKSKEKISKRINKEKEQYEIQIKNRNGQKIWVLISASPVNDANGNVIGSLGIHTDISIWKKAEEDIKSKNLELLRKNDEIAKEKEKVEMANKALKEAYDKLMNLEEFKESMTQMIVHDLKNPLNNIIGLSQKAPNKDETDIINQAGLQMLNMVLNILDTQKIEDAKIKLNLKTSSIALVLQDALRQVKVLVKQKGLKIINKIEEKYQSKFDYDIITRVMVNLLTNSIKYSPSFGEIFIDTKPIKNNNEDFLQISVSDKGMGIPKENMDRVFDKFSVLGSKSSNSIHSTGLGLYFCKMMIEAHRGKIWVESDKQNGTSFYFTLPKSIDMVDAPLNALLKLNGSTELKFSMDEKKLMEPFMRSFKNIQVYETSKSLDVLKEIDKFEHKMIKRWKEEMETAIFNCDEEKYHKLLSFNLLL